MRFFWFRKRRSRSPTEAAKAELIRWAFVDQDSRKFVTPDAAYLSLCGRVKGHPKKSDGSTVLTSPVVSWKGNLLTTGSTTYELGAMHPDYAEWLKDLSLLVDEKDPLANRKQ